MKSVNLAYGDGDLVEFTQHDPNIIQILHDDDTGFKMRNGLPETYGGFHSVFVTLNREWQEWWFEQLKLCFPRAVGETESEWMTELVRLWEGLIADKVCFTDFNAPQNGRADFITGTNPDADGIAHKSIWNGGNLLKKLGGIVRRGGYDSYQVECLDGTKPPPPIKEVNRYTRPDLIHGGTVRTKITLPDGRRRIDPFPRGRTEVPYLNICNVYVKNSAGVKVFDHNYIRKVWTRDVPFRANRNPYWPER